MLCWGGAAVAPDHRRAWGVNEGASQMCAAQQLEISFCNEEREVVTEPNVGVHMCVLHAGVCCVCGCVLCVLCMGVCCVCAACGGHVHVCAFGGCSRACACVYTCVCARVCVLASMFARICVRICAFMCVHVRVRVWTRV